MARSAPSFTQASHFSALPAVANTLWPKAFTIWVAATPLPLDPPYTRTDSPRLRAARSNTLLHTVKKVSGKDAASTGVMPFGIGRHCGAGAGGESAEPAPPHPRERAAP